MPDQIAVIPPNNVQPLGPLHIAYHNSISSVLTWLAGQRLVPTAVQTASYSPAPRDLALFDASSANLTAALPIAPADMTCIEVKLVATAASHTVTVTAGGTDQFDDGTTSKALATAGSVLRALYWQATSRWYFTLIAGGTAMTNPMTTAGDMITGASAGAPQRLAVGSSNQALIVSAGAPAWGTVPVAGGGTGVTTQQAALDALAGAVTNNQVLAGNGTHVTLRALAAADIPYDTTATDIKAPGTQSAGTTSAVPKADHVHPATFTCVGYLAPAVVTLTDAATITVDASLGNHMRVTLAGNRTLGNPTNSVDGQQLMFEVIQDATGSRTLAYGTNYAFSTDLPSPTLTTTASKRDLLSFTYSGSMSKWMFKGIIHGF